MNHALNSLDLYDLVPVFVEHMDRAGKAGIKGMDRPEDLKRFLRVLHRVTQKGCFIRTEGILTIPRSCIPGRRNNCLVILDLALSITIQ